VASIISAGSVWVTAGGTQTVTATPAIGDLIVVVAATSGLAGGTTAVTDDNSSGTYTQVDSDRSGFSTTGILTIWVRTALIAAASSTIFTMAQVGSSGGGGVVLRVAAMTATGSGAVRSNGGQSTASGTPAPVLSNTPLLKNPIISAVGNGTNGGSVTPRTGYSNTTPSGYNTPATGLVVTWLEQSETTATITWGGASGSTFASVAIELSAPDIVPRDQQVQQSYVQVLAH